MSGRRTTVGVIAVAVVCALSTGCTVRTDSRAASAEGPIAAADDLGAGPPVAGPPAGDRTSEVTSTGPDATTTEPVRVSASTTSSTTEPPLTGWAATDAYLLRRIIGGGSTAASFAISVDDPAEVYGDLRGDRVPFGFDLEWETVRGGLYPWIGTTRYEVACNVHGEILVGD